MDDLIKRLATLADCDARAGEPLGKCMREAAAALAEAQAEIARLREALIAVKHSGSLIYAKMTARAALEVKHG